MKKIKPFNEFEIIYDVDFSKILPKEMIANGHQFVLGNIMKHSDMYQVTYENKLNEWGIPSTLEFDFYFSKKDGKMRIDVDITLGDAVVCEFYIESPNFLGKIYFTEFKLDKKCVEGLVKFLNLFNGFRFIISQFDFLF